MHIRVKASHVVVRAIHVLYVRTVEYVGFVASKFEGCVTKFARHKALKMIA